MASYQVIRKKRSKYQAVIYSVSYNNPIHDIREISEYMRKHIDVEGYVLFDLLLSNGENFNRFTEGYFDGYEISFNSLKVIELTDAQEIQAINSFYQNNRKLLDNSVLSPSEKFRYARK
ncbi:type II toxin-antitoxin system RnlB family antitoxin [Frisingicoccus sp.]|uniref:type II toxin-antitoxin system RnlB family antitoxin n=1 Tax=Frisingicoccus sp. TaxID=1918627 RepID=UPI003AB507CF